MKNMNRWLAVLMCLCVLGTSVFGDVAVVLAEAVGEPVIAEEPVVGETEAIETVAPETTPEGTTTPSVIPTEMPTVEPELELGGSEEADALLSDAQNGAAGTNVPPQIDYTADATHSDAFVFGYAQMLADAALYPEHNALNEAVATLRQTGVVLVVERRDDSGLDRVRVAFAYEDAVVLGWVDASAVRPMSDEETAAFQAGLTEAICYEEDVNYPLSAPELVLSEAEDAGETAEPTQEPEAEPTQEPEAEPTQEPEAEPTQEPDAEPTQVPGAEPTQEPEVEPSQTPEAEAGDNAGQEEASGELGESDADPLEGQNGAAVCELTLAESEGSLSVGQSVQIEAQLAGEENHEITYALTDATVVQVGADGVVTALSEGVAEVRVICRAHGTSAVFSVTVTAAADVPQEEAAEKPEEADSVAEMPTEAPEAGALDGVPAELALKVGETGTAAGSSEGEIVYSSDDEGVAVVDPATGAVTAVAEGVCVVTAAMGEESAECRVTVRAVADDIELVSAKTTIGLNETTEPVEVQLYSDAAPVDGIVTYASSDAQIVSIDDAGRLTGAGIGTAVITANAAEAVSASFEVTVTAEPDAIAVSADHTEYIVGQTGRIQYTLTEGTSAAVSFETSDASVAVVDPDGLVTAVGPGACDITARTHNGLSEACRISVANVPDRIVIGVSTLNVIQGMTASLPIEFQRDDGQESAATYTLQSSNSNVTIVGNQIYARETGSAMVQATTANGKSATVQVIVRSAPTRVSLDATSMNLGLGMSKRLTARIRCASGDFVYTRDDRYEIGRFASTNSDVATVDDDGVIRAVAPGKVTITLTTKNGKTQSCMVTVSKGPSWMEFRESHASLSMDQTTTLTCNMTAGALADRTYSSANEEIARVEGSGATCKVIAVSPGTTTITCEASNGVKATCKLTVYARPDAIAFVRQTQVIGNGQTVALPAILVTSGSGECAQQATYSSGNSEVVQVSAAGEVTGLKTGSAVITATTYNGKTAACTVTVKAPPTSITIRADRTQLAVGDTARVYTNEDGNSTFSYSVSDKSVLSVDANGVVKALRSGTATITARTYNGYSDGIEIRVMEIPSSVTLDVGELTLGEGMSRTLTASIPEGSMGTIVFRTANDQIATVDAQGKVTAVAPGQVLISAHVVDHEDVFDICAVTVQAMPDRVALSDSAMELKVGATARLTATLQSDSGADCYGGVSFESSNDSIVRIDGSGKMTAASAGTAQITATADADESVYAVCSVEVIDSRVYLDADALTLGLGETYQLRITTPGGVDNLSVAHDNSGAVEVNANGLITARKLGQSTVTVTNAGETAQCVVTVVAAPERVVLNAAEKQMVVGDSFLLNARLEPEGSASRLRYASDNDAVASVDENGRIIAASAGTARITVSTFDARVQAVCTVKVVYAPEMIRFGELTDIVLAKGDRYVLEEPVMYSSKGECSATYTLAISNSGCASLSFENGGYVITAKEEGTAALYLKTSNGKTARCNLKVFAAPTKIGFADENLVLGLGELYRPVVYGDNGAVVSCTLTSSKSSVVSVQADGTLKAEATGEATITAKADAYSLQASVTVQVVALPGSMELNASARTLGIGETFVLKPSFGGGTAASVEYVSDNEAVLSVNRYGYVVANAPGTATVTAKLVNGVKAACTFVVKKAPTALSIHPKTITACLVDAVQLRPVFGGDDEYANAVYSVMDNGVAQVSESGRVTFKALGETVVYVRTYNGLAVEVPVTVKETPTSVAFDRSTAVILKGDQAQLGIVFDKGAGYCELTSSDDSVLSVDEKGWVTAHKAGKVTVRLNMPGFANMSASCSITVVDKLDGVVLTADEPTLELHEQTKLRYTLLPENAIGTGLIQFSSSDSSVASVDPKTGVVTGEAYGTATMTITLGDGQIGTCPINVLGGKRRMMIAYYFGETGDSGYMPFASNNGNSMKEAFQAATVEGQKYSILGPMSNAPKTELFASIDSHFADATDDDVSLLYLCAHGSGSYGPAGEYAFSLRDVASWNDTAGYVTASELMVHLEKIKGRVVVVMDSCHAGGLIDCLKDRLDAENGRISILASSHRSTKSSYWDVSSKLTSVDFYTFALLEGLGFNEGQGLKGRDRGWFTTTPPADVNGDSQVTMKEFFSYGYSGTLECLKRLYGDSRFHGDPNQVPQSYYGANGDLVLFKR